MGNVCWLNKYMTRLSFVRGLDWKEVNGKSVSIEKKSGKDVLTVGSKEYVLELKANKLIAKNGSTTLKSLLYHNFGNKSHQVHWVLYDNDMDFIEKLRSEVSSVSEKLKVESRHSAKDSCYWAMCKGLWWSECPKMNGSKHKDLCIVCGKPFTSTTEYKQAQCEHLLPWHYIRSRVGAVCSATQGSVASDDEDDKVVEEYSEVVKRPLRSVLFRWAHHDCNNIKSNALWVTLGAVRNTIKIQRDSIMKTLIDLCKSPACSERKKVIFGKTSLLGPEIRKWCTKRCKEIADHINGILDILNRNRMECFDIATARLARKMHGSIRKSLLERRRNLRKNTKMKAVPS